MKTRFLIRALLSTLVFSSIIFIAAWKIDYLQGWIFLVTNLITALMNFAMIQDNAALMAERSRIAKDAKSWDKKILGISSIVYILNIIIAGLDSGRYHWSPEFHWSVSVVGIGLTLV